MLPHCRTPSGTKPAETLKQWTESFDSRMPISEIREPKGHLVMSLKRSEGPTDVFPCSRWQFHAVGCSDNFSRLSVVDLSIRSWLLWSLRAWTTRSGSMFPSIQLCSQGPNHQAHQCQILQCAQKPCEEVCRSLGIHWVGWLGRTRADPGTRLWIQQLRLSVFSRNNGGFILKQDGLNFRFWLQLIFLLVLLSLNSMIRGRMPSKSCSKCFYCCEQTHSRPPTFLTVCHAWASGMEALQVRSPSRFFSWCDWCEKQVRAETIRKVGC